MPDVLIVQLRTLVWFLNFELKYLLSIWYNVYNYLITHMYRLKYVSVRREEIIINLIRYGSTFSQESRMEEGSLLKDAHAHSM